MGKALTKEVGTLWFLSLEQLPLYEGSIPIMVKIPCLFFPLKNECPIVGILHSRTVICSCDIHHICDESISLCGTGIVVSFLAVTKF